LYEQTSDFLQAMKLAPQRVKQVITEIFLKDREEREARCNMRRVGRRSDERKGDLCLMNLEVAINIDGKDADTIRKSNEYLVNLKGRAGFSSPVF